MSERAATLITEDMQYMGPVKVSEVESAQQRMVDIVRRLEDSGEVIIMGRGGAKESEADAEKGSAAHKSRRSSIVTAGGVSMPPANPALVKRAGQRFHATVL
jgi:hypothetical protein